MKDLHLVIRENVDLNNLTEEQEQALMYCLLKAYVMLAEAEKEDYCTAGEFRLWRIFLALTLTSELDALCGGNANSATYALLRWSREFVRTRSDKTKRTPNASYR